MTDALLSVSDLEKRFGGIVAVDQLDLAVERNSITGLIGPNGAGKTTTFKLISGFLTPDGGSIEFAGQDISGDAAHEVARAGITRTFQEARTLDELSVLENLMVGGTDNAGERVGPATRGLRAYREDEADVFERANDLLEYMDLAAVRDEQAGTLSVGQRKLVEISRALMTEPDLILLDEPMAGLPSDDMSVVMDYVERLRAERDQTFLIVEHNMDVIMNLCDTITVMDAGSDIAHGSPESIQSDSEVIEAYLGEGEA
jgi:ABC-type branched-subunit amino acid transport system ATPase component